MLQNTTLKFLKGLRNNNNKPWFEDHRQDYDAAREDFQSFIESIIGRHSKKDEDISSLKAKECMFRINRDVRFSKDKSPYKANLGASIARGGKKSIFAGYYFHCEPGQSFTGGGIWMPMPAEVKKIRQEIDYCFEEFSAIVRSKKFKSVYGDLDKEEQISLTNVPKGYEKDNPAAEYVKLKSWIATRKITDAELTSKGLGKLVLESFEVLQPLVKFINKGLE